MKLATLISAIITILCLITTMICGLWIRANNITESSSINFHVNSGILSIIFAVITLILVIILLNRLKNKEVKL